MAGLSLASVIAFFGYFFLIPTSVDRIGQGVPGPRGQDTPSEGFVPANVLWGIAFHHQELAELPDIGHVTGAGVAISDFNGDGRLDVYLPNSTSGAASRHRPCGLYLARADGGFEVVPEAGGADPGGLNMGAYAVDYDGDGDMDLFITRLGPDLLFENDGSARFHNATARSGIDNRRWSTGAAWADYDRDGDLDLYIVNYLAFDPDDLPTEVTRALDREEEAKFNPYLFDGVADVLFRNNGDGTFTEVTSELGITETEGKGLSVAFVDLNADDWPDLYVTNDVSPNTLYVNQQGSVFVDRGVAAGVADPRAGMSVSVGDYDLDGHFDLFCTHWQDQVNVLYRNAGSLSFSGLAARDAEDQGYPLVFDDVTEMAGLSRCGLGLTGWGALMFDADHDGDLDLYITNGYTSPDHADRGTCVPQPDRLLINENGRFVDRSLDLLSRVPPGAGRGLAAGDLDGDGDLDLVRTNNNGPALVLENRLADGHWLIVRPAGPVVVGCRISLISGGRQQVRIIQGGMSFLSSGPAEAHFGLGAYDVVASLEVIWPDGHRRVWRNVRADQRFTAERGS